MNTSISNPPKTVKKRDGILAWHFLPADGLTASQLDLLALLADGTDILRRVSYSFTCQWVYRLRSDDPYVTIADMLNVECLISAGLAEACSFTAKNHCSYLRLEITDLGRAALARELQTPGPELYRHDLAVYFASHRADAELFAAQIDNVTPEEEAQIVEQWHRDLFGEDGHS